MDRIAQFDELIDLFVEEFIERLHAREPGIAIIAPSSSTAADSHASAHQPRTAEGGNA